MSSSPSAPPAPDYKGAAEQTAAGNLEAIKYQTEANRVNQVTPFGNLNYSQDPSGKWTQTTTLDPKVQAALDQQMSIQQGKSEQAGSMLDSVKNSYNQPFDAPDLQGYLSGAGQVKQGDLGQAGQFSSGARQDTSFDSTAPELTTSYDRFGSNTPGLDTNAYGFSGAGSGQDTRNLSASQYARGVQGVDQNAQAYLGNVNSVNQNAPQYDPSQANTYAQKAYDAQMALMRPGLDDQQTKLQNSLALQGLNVGTEANNNAQSSYSMARAAQENALAASSYLSGNDAARADYNSQLQGFQAGNQAQNQAYDQGMGVFGANNNARTQALNNRLSVQQGDLASQAASNNARNTSFNQNATTYGLNNQAVQQANQARTQQLQNELAQFGANQGATTAENQARSQMLAQQLAQYQAQNQAQSQQYGQDLGTYGANLQGLTTNAQLQGAQNTAQQQAYNQAVGNYGMDWQQAQTLRNQPLNELNALLTGQQVQNPQFSSYALQGNAGGADMLGATQAQGQWDQGIYNQQAASAAGNNSAAAGLAGTAMMAIAMY